MIVAVAAMIHVAVIGMLGVTMIVVAMMIEMAMTNAPVIHVAMFGVLAIAMFVVVMV
jgi:hypothetical protein